MKRPSVNYKSELLRDLSDPSDCAQYLSFCLSESKETFLLGLKHVAQAQGGMKKLADAARVNRENLYHMLSDNGNPRLDNLTAVIAALGLDIEIVPKRVPEKITPDRLVREEIENRRGLTVNVPSVGFAKAALGIPLPFYPARGPIAGNIYDETLNPEIESAAFHSVVIPVDDFEEPAICSVPQNTYAASYYQLPLEPVAYPRTIANNP